MKGHGVSNKSLLAHMEVQQVEAIIYAVSGDCIGSCS